MRGAAAVDSTDGRGRRGLAFRAPVANNVSTHGATTTPTPFSPHLERVTFSIPSPPPGGRVINLLEMAATARAAS
jgi:hypothetical protein